MVRVTHRPGPPPGDNAGPPAGDWLLLQPGTYGKSEPNFATVLSRHPGGRRHRGAADRDAPKLQWTGAGQALTREARE